MASIRADAIRTHKNAIEELYDLDTETQLFELSISNFLLKHPELAGISYASAILLMHEKDFRVANAAIEKISIEIQRRCDVHAPGFQLKNRKVTENQVRKIIHAEREQRRKEHKPLKAQSTKIMLECPHCGKQIAYKRTTRSKVVSFRTTEGADNAIDYLSDKWNISRSGIISELLYIEKRFGPELQ